jgi:hypothetical protein
MEHGGFLTSALTLVTLSTSTIMMRYLEKETELEIAPSIRVNLKHDVGTDHAVIEVQGTARLVAKRAPIGVVSRRWNLFLQWLRE